MWFYDGRRETVAENGTARWMRPCNWGQSRATPLFGSSRGATRRVFTFASDNDRRAAGNVEIASRNRLFNHGTFNYSFEIAELKIEMRHDYDVIT